MANVYFGVKKTEKFYLDGEKNQWIEFKKLPEGERIQFEDSVNSKLRLDRATNMVEMDTKTGSDRAALIKIAVVGFNILNEDGTTDNVFTKEKWENLYFSMDADKAEELYEAILIFNGFKKNE